MKNLISQLRQIEGIQFNPPCTLEQLDELAGGINLKALPQDLITLYLDHDGSQDARSVLPMRLMSHIDVIKLYPAIEEYPFYEYACFFWTDDNSNYAGLYVSGSLEGKVGFHAYDGEQDVMPRFRSLRNFYEAMLKHPRKLWADLPSDYPLTQPVPVTDATDMALAEQLIRNYEKETDADKRNYFACCAMNLIPFSESDYLTPFLRDDDTDTIVHACEIIALHKYESAVPELISAMNRAWGYGRLAVLGALGAIGTDEAKLALLHIAPTLPVSSLWHIARALERCGYETKRIDNDFFYREAGSEDWLPL